ncbi:hypothetical protein D3C84_1202280 [compost metagenome]
MVLEACAKGCARTVPTHQAGAAFDRFEQAVFLRGGQRFSGDRVVPANHDQVVTG